MNQRERLDSYENALMAAFGGLQSLMWTAVPGIVVGYNAEQGTCVVQPSIKTRIQNEQGGYTWLALAPLADVPVVFMGGGSGVLTFPIQQGDEALIVFSSRCIDGWWQNGGVQVQNEIRLHDQSDGFAIIGPRSLARALTNVSTTTTQLRSLDGSTYVELASGQVVNIVAPGGVNITGPLTVSGPTSLQDGLSVEGNSTMQGDMSLEGTMTASGEGTFNGITVSTHVHGGVATGGGTTGAPQG